MDAKVFTCMWRGYSVRCQFNDPQCPFDIFVCDSHGDEIPMCDDDYETFAAALDELFLTGKSNEITCARVDGDSRF